MTESYPELNEKCVLTTEEGENLEIVYGGLGLWTTEDGQIWAEDPCRPQFKRVRLANSGDGTVRMKGRSQ